MTEEEKIERVVKAIYAAASNSKTAGDYREYARAAISALKLDLAQTEVQPQPNPDPEVTPEMIEAGYDILANCVEGYDDKFSLARRIYRAMKAKEPL